MAIAFIERPQLSNRLYPVTYNPPDKLNTCELEPRPSQLTGAYSLRAFRRYALHDVPGYGKTLQAAMAAVTPVGISAPTYAISKWAEWLDLYIPASRSHIYVASKEGMSHKERQAILVEAAADPLAWVLFNKEMVRPIMAKVQMAGKWYDQPVRRHTAASSDFSHAAFEWDYYHPAYLTQIIDEAHHYRVPGAWHTWGMERHTEATPLIFQLTATPMYKDFTSLFAQLRLLAPAQFPSFYKFRVRYGLLWDTGWTKKVYGTQNDDELTQLIARFALHRDYAPGEVPDVFPMDDIVVPTPSKLRERFRVMAKDYRDGQSIFTSASQAYAAMRAASAECTVKLEALAGAIDDTSRRWDGTRRGNLILCHHVPTAHLIDAFLRNHRSKPLQCAVITGEVNRDKRAWMAEHADNIIGTIDAMGESIDCSHLSLVHVFEEWYHPGGDYQAIARSARQRHTSHPRAIAPPHDQEPVLIQRYRLDVGPDKATHDCLEQRTTSTTAIMDATIRHSVTL